MFGNDIKENILYFAGRLYGGTRSQAATVLKFLVWPMGEELVSELNLGLLKQLSNILYVAK